MLGGESVVLRSDLEVKRKWMKVVVDGCDGQWADGHVSSGEGSRAAQVVSDGCD